MPLIPEELQQPAPSSKQSEASLLCSYERRHWSVLYTRARHEKKVAGFCEMLALPSYLPLRPSRTVSGGKVNTFLIPMFPGYLFVALGPGDLGQIKRSNAVVQQIRPHDEESLLGDLRNVWAVEQASLQLTVSTELRRGQRVLVTRGPLAGVTGTILRYKNRHRLQVMVEAINQSVLVDIAKDDVSPLLAGEGPPRSPRGGA